jgi:hypothetical protein
LVPSSIDIGGSKPAWRITPRSTHEIFGRDVIEFSPTTSGIKIIVVWHFIIQHSHTSIIAQDIE